MDELFTLVWQLAQRTAVTEIAVPKWLVQQHGLAPLACRAGVRELRDDLARSAVAWAHIESDLVPVVTALARWGVRVVPIKGVAYAKTLYANPAERPMNDIDLLVQPGQVESAREVLRRDGFTRGKTAELHHAEPWTRGDAVIDLHWNIIAPGRSRIDLTAVWSRTRAGWPEGAERLDDIDALVFHFVHLSRNRLRLPLVNVVDSVRLGELTDPAAALARARSWGLGRAVALANRFCDDVLAGTRRPGGWLGPSRDELERIEQPHAARRIVFDLAVAGSARQLAWRVAHVAANLVRTRGRRP